MLIYALVETDDPITLELFLTAAAAEQALADVLVDEPDWRPLLRVVRLKLAASAIQN